MKMTKFTYNCPHASNCPVHKKCHVLTTTEELDHEIKVLQQCPAAGKNADGTKKVIEICIGHAA